MLALQECNDYTIPLMARPKKSPTPGKDLFIPINIGIIGYGYVGQAVAYGFMKGSGGKDIICYYDKFKPSLPLKDVVENSEFIFVSLPTPMKADEGGIDLTIVDENVEEIVKYATGTDKVVVIKSTVTPGATSKYEKLYPKVHFAFNPEFLTEANFLDDFVNADRTIIGSSNDLVSRRLAVAYKQRFPQTTVYQTDPTTAETVKYFANTFLPLKVTFANFFYDYCQKIGIKYEEVKKLAAIDPRIVDAHLDVTTLRGFGGKCFPKDLVALMGEMAKEGLDTSLFEAMWEYNKKVRKVHDWDEIPFAVSGNEKKSATRKSHHKLNKPIYS